MAAPGQLVFDNSLPPLAVRFSLGRTQSEGRLSTQSSRDFPTLLRLFNGDEFVQLLDRAGSWRARIDIWEPSSLNPMVASFRFRVLERLE
jgi:hypothetical protein